MKKRVYRIRTQYIFEGVFEVVAESTAKGHSGLRNGDGWKRSQHPSR